MLMTIIGVSFVFVNLWIPYKWAGM